MSFICPFCNGMSPLTASCPHCGAAAEDEGRREDWSGPYSPYEPLASGAIARSEAGCQHLARCTACGESFLVDVGFLHG